MDGSAWVQSQILFITLWEINSIQNNCSTQSIHIHVLAGDLGYYDETEHIFIVDRLKDVIKYKTMQVSLLIPLKIFMLLWNRKRVD